MNSTSPRVELVSIGDELLLGHTVDTNTSWLADALAERGIRTVRRTSVGDDEADIVDAVGSALDRTGGVICTGGLGPTRDDLTRPAVARLFGREIHVRQEVLDEIGAYFARSGRSMAASNRRQAEVPEGALVLRNAYGTAPGLILTRADDAFVALLPGVPREMRGIFRDALLPWLLERWPARSGGIRHLLLRTTGIAESELAELIEPLLGDEPAVTCAYLPSAAGVDLRLTSWGDRSETDADAALERVSERLRARIDGWVYAVGRRDLAEAVADRLRARGWTLALAESCTGGLIAKRLTDAAGASDFLLGGVVAYANSAKTGLLDVSEALLAHHGAVSEPVALAMAQGVAERFGAGCSIAVTGIAGPGGGSAQKPVGTVCIAASVAGRAEVRTLRLNGDRTHVREGSAQAALTLLWRLLPEEGTR